MQPTSLARTSDLAAAVAASVRMPGAGENAYAVILRLTRDKLRVQLTPHERAQGDAQVRAVAERVIRATLTDYRQTAPLQNLPPIDLPDAEILRRILADVLGFGVLDTYLRDETIEEIIVNGDTMWTIGEGGKRREAIVMPTEMEMLDLINRLVGSSGRQVSLSSPRLDAQLPDGSRIKVVIAPCADPSPSITIRRHRLIARAIEDLIRLGSLDELAAQFLAAVIKARLGILVAGGTSSGKTNFLNVLSGLLPLDERILVIEDTHELELVVPDKQYLLTRTASAEGTGEVTMGDLVRDALRMRPDRIVIGEVRGAEALDMLLAANTGHEGFMATVHANSAAQALTRLAQLVQLAPQSGQLKEKTIAEWIAAAFQYVVFLRSDYVTKRRVVEEIIELTGAVESENRILHQPIFRRGAESALQRQPYPLAHLDRLRERGVDPTPFAPRANLPHGGAPTLSRSLR